MPSLRMANTFCVASHIARASHSPAIQNPVYERWFLGRVAMAWDPTPLTMALRTQCSESLIACSERPACENTKSPYCAHENQDTHIDHHPDTALLACVERIHRTRDTRSGLHRRWPPRASPGLSRVGLLELRIRH